MHLFCFIKLEKFKSPNGYQYQLQITCTRGKMKARKAKEHLEAYSRERERTTGWHSLTNSQVFAGDRRKWRLLLRALMPSPGHGDDW